MRKPLLFLLSSIIIFLVYFAYSFRPGGNLVEVKRFPMGTIVEIKVSLDDNGLSRKDAEEAIARAHDEIDRIESVFSVYKEDSEISKINRLKAGKALKISGETFYLIDKAIEYNKETKGAFDITVKPLVDLWNRSKENKILPSDSDIKNALAKVGSQYIILDKANKTISFKKEGMAIDMGGIAKGYATERAIGILKDNGVKNAIVNSGGDMYCLGRKSVRDKWMVGIQHPRESGRIFMEIKLEDRAIDTSGDYEKFFMIDGKRYSHIIDPRTGHPIGDDVVSATTITGDSVMADAFATALCVLGRDGLDSINSMKGIDAILIFKEGSKLNIEMSREIRLRYELIEGKG